MNLKFTSALKNGFNKLRDNPQLWFSVFVALVILFSFIFVTNRFITIAQDAQDNLVNIRMGFMLESFVEFAPEDFETKEGINRLQSIITRISFRNSSITSFKIVEFQNGEPVIVASLQNDLIGTIDSQNKSFYNIGKINTEDSYTLERFVNRERIFSTVQIIENNLGEPVGAVLVEQSLSEADLKISQEITQSVMIFVVIVVMIMFLFFRHAKIIDYTALYRKLKEVDGLKDDFISMASHELRTPLTVIRGYAEELRESKNIDKEMKVSAERIDIAAKQLDELVGDMLDVSRIEQGRMKIDLQNINPIETLADVVSGFVPVAKNKGLTLAFKHNLSLQKIAVDPARFRQVMVNLIGNAIKYTPTGEVKVNAEPKENSIEFRISDSGIGISSEDQKKLFQKFQRISSTETSEIRGTGLGLWITKQIVEQMGGAISVESIKGVGTHFIVEFPIV
jgi:signal transduction histidine kinase